MTTKAMIAELNAVAEKHKDDLVHTFQTNITAMCRDIIPKLEQLAEYETIGTVDECREAMEKQKLQTPDIWGDGYDKEGNIIYEMYDCPGCGQSYEIDDKYEHCPKCGQALNWRGFEKLYKA